jgi:hypothetical protein
MLPQHNTAAWMCLQEPGPPDCPLKICPVTLPRLHRLDAAGLLVHSCRGNEPKKTHAAPHLLVC